jgi:hypothetical protein
MYQSVCLPLYLSASSIYLSVCLPNLIICKISMSLSAYIYIFRSICMYLPMCLSDYPFIHPSIHVSIYVCLSICPPNHLSITYIQMDGWTDRQPTECLCMYTHTCIHTYTHIYRRTHTSTKPSIQPTLPCLPLFVRTSLYIRPCMLPNNNLWNCDNG